MSHVTLEVKRVFELQQMESKMMNRETKEYIEFRRSIYIEILGSLIARYDDDPGWSKQDIVYAAWEYAEWAADFELQG